MTTVISSHVKDKNCIFTGYEIFITSRKILVFYRCLYNKIQFTNVTHYLSPGVLKVYYMICEFSEKN